MDDATIVGLAGVACHARILLKFFGRRSYTMPLPEEELVQRIKEVQKLKGKLDVPLIEEPDTASLKKNWGRYF